MILGNLVENIFLETLILIYIFYLRWDEING